MTFHSVIYKPTISISKGEKPLSILRLFPFDLGFSRDAPLIHQYGVRRKSEEE